MEGPFTPWKSANTTNPASVPREPVVNLYQYISSWNLLRVLWSRECRPPGTGWLYLRQTERLLYAGAKLAMLGAEVTGPAGRGW